MLTDKIATWVAQEIVAGPFNTPPLEGFRSNALMAIKRNGKVRPVINMSGPYKGSFNANLKRESLEKVWMSTAKAFSYTVREAGHNALMSKFDLCDAYKIVPARKEDWRLQGFSWLGKIFLETQMIFGAVPSVANFDRLGSTLVELAVAESGINRKYVHRTLDDIPVVSPENSGFTESFTGKFKMICKELKIDLAENYVKNEKAFEMQTRGVVLGIGFDTNKMKWFLSKEKADKIKRRVIEALNTSHMSLEQVQKLMGSINDLSQLCPFLKPFQATGNRFLAKFQGNENIILMDPAHVKNDWLICARVAESAKNGLPIAARPGLPSIFAL